MWNAIGRAIKRTPPEVFAVATRAMRSAMISLPYVRLYWLVHASPRKQAKVDDKVVALFLKDRSDKAEIARCSWSGGDSSRTPQAAD